MAYSTRHVFLSYRNIPKSSQKSFQEELEIFAKTWLLFDAPDRSSGAPVYEEKTETCTLSVDAPDRSGEHRIVYVERV
jgi:hypothetical protein